MNNTKTYHFYGLEAFMKNAQEEMDLANIEPASLSYSSQALKNEKDAKNVFFPALKRIGFNDLCFDLLYYYLPQETRLANKGQLPETQPFFNQFMQFLDKKANDLIRQQYYSLISLAYMDNYPKVQAHWNFIDKLDEQHCNTLIQTEIFHHANRAYDLLKEHFSTKQLSDFRWTFARGQIDKKGAKNKLIDDFYSVKHPEHSCKTTLNLKEMSVFYSLICQPEQVSAFRALSQTLDSLNLPSDKQKIIGLLVREDIQYERLNYPEFNEIKEQLIAYRPLEKLLPERQEFSLIEIGLYNQMNHNLGKMLEQYLNQSKFEAKGLNENHFNNPSALLSHYASDLFISTFIEDFLNSKIKAAKKNENKSFWSYLKMDLTIAEKYQTGTHKEEQNIAHSNLKI